MKKHLWRKRNCTGTWTPSNDSKGWHYVAEGDWDLLGVDSGLVTGRQFIDWRPVMVAGVRFELTTFGL
jgi:hypothetical protein